MLTGITIENVSALIRSELEKKNKEFNVTFRNGEKKKMRLFVGTTGQIGYFPPRQRRRGYILDLGTVTEIDPVQQREGKPIEEKFRIHARKLADMLTASGLWQNIVSELKNADYDYKKYADREPELAYQIATWNVKKMDFRRKYGSQLYGDNAADYAEIKRHMDAGVNYHIPRREGRYDTSFRFEVGMDARRAWYNEEYRNCGNGHYYLAIDHERAIYYCKD